MIPIFAIGISFVLTYVVLILLAQLFVYLSNSIIDFITPIGLSILVSIVLAYISFETLKMQSGLIASLFVRSNEIIIRMALILSIGVLIFSAGIKYSYIDSIEKSIISYQEKTRAWSDSVGER